MVLTVLGFSSRIRGRFHCLTRFLLMKFLEAPESMSACRVFSALFAIVYRVVKN